MVKNSKLLTAKEARQIDIFARDKLGVPTLALMENAGRHIACEALKSLRQRKSVAIFCGKGNNGGDGFVACRHLLTVGIKPDIFLAGSISQVKNEAGVNLQILLKLNQRITEVKEENLIPVRKKIAHYALIIDALLGVGLSGRVRGIFRDIIEIINLSKVYILSVDIPSGLDATTGKALGCCVKADKTVTFAAKKQGMVLKEGPGYCGKVIVRDLGVPLFK